MLKESAPRSPVQRSVADLFRFGMNNKKNQLEIVILTFKKVREKEFLIVIVYQKWQIDAAYTRQLFYFLYYISILTLFYKYNECSCGHCNVDRK